MTTDTNVGNISCQTLNLADAYNNNAVLSLTGWQGDWEACKQSAKNGIRDILNLLKNACSTMPGINTDALQYAYDKTLNLYYALVTGASGKAGGKSNERKTYNYEGTDYIYYSKNWYREKTATGVEFARTMGGEDNATGLQWNYSSAGNDSDEFYLNIRCMMDIFRDFYLKGLG